MGTDCKSVGEAYAGSNPALPTSRPRSSAAEHFFGKEEVTGSILVEGSSAPGSDLGLNCYSCLTTHPLVSQTVPQISVFTAKRCGQTDL